MSNDNHDNLGSSNEEEKPKPWESNVYLSNLKIRATEMDSRLLWAPGLGETWDIYRDMGAYAYNKVLQ